MHTDISVTAILLVRVQCHPASMCVHCQNACKGCTRLALSSPQVCQHLHLLPQMLSQAAAKRYASHTPTSFDNTFDYMSHLTTRYSCTAWAHFVTGATLNFANKLTRCNLVSADKLTNLYHVCFPDLCNAWAHFVTGVIFFSANKLTSTYNMSLSLMCSCM